MANKEKYIWAIRVSHGEIEKYKCKVGYENKGLNKISIIGLYGKDREFWCKYDKPFRGFYLIREENLSRFLQDELRKQIEVQRIKIRESETKIKFYNEELLKLN